MATWLALVAAGWALLDLAGSGRISVPPSVVVTLLLAALVGLVVAQRATLFVLAVVGLAGQFLTIADDHGLGVATVLIMVTGLLTWLFGAVRGAVGPRPGAGRLVVAGLVLVVLLQVAVGAVR